MTERFEETVDIVHRAWQRMSDADRERSISDLTADLAARVRSDPNATVEDLKSALAVLIRHFKSARDRELCRESHRSHVQSGTA